MQLVEYSLNTEHGALYRLLIVFHKDDQSNLEKLYNIDKKIMICFQSLIHGRLYYHNAQKIVCQLQILWATVPNIEDTCKSFFYTGLQISYFVFCLFFPLMSVIYMNWLLYSDSFKHNCINSSVGSAV